MLSTFAPETRDDARNVARGLRQLDRGPRAGDQHHDPRARALHALPAARDAEPVRPDTELRNFFPGLGAAAAEAAPVAEVQARWFGEMATTFAAIARDPQALRETIEESPPTLQVATESFRVQTPFLARFAAVSRDLQPGAAQLPRTLPLVNDALQAGVPAFRQTPELGERLEDLFRAAEDLGDNPSTLLALRDLRKAVQVTPPGDRVRGALPDGLQLLRLLLQPARHAPVGRRPGRHAPSASSPSSPTPSRRTRSASTESTHPVDVPTDQDPQGEPAQAVAPHPVRRPGDRRQRPRRLPGGPDRLSGPARDEPALPAGQLRRAASSAAAATWSSTRTRPASPAAPSSRASSASTTWRTCHERLQGRRPRHHDARAARPTSASRRRTRSPTRTS